MFLARRGGQVPLVTFCGDEGGGDVLGVPHLVDVTGWAKEAMTQDEAAKEAVKRWGPGGKVRFRPPSPGKGRDRGGRLARYRYLVGNGHLGASCTILGQGHSWSEAFDDARPRMSTGRVEHA
jgi:hypothetical protein